MGAQERSADETCGPRKASLVVEITDLDAHFLNSATAVEYSLGYFEPDANNKNNVLIVDNVYLAVSQLADGDISDTTYVLADVLLGSAGTSILSTLPKLSPKTSSAAAPMLSSSGAAGCRAAVVNSTYKEIAAGQELVASVAVYNTGSATVGHGQIRVEVEGHWKNEF
jgi:hypothetical protein